MNQEERRQKRQDEFKHAAVVVTVFVLVLAVMIIGAAAALHKFLPKGTKEVKTPDTLKNAGSPVRCIAMFCILVSISVVCSVLRRLSAI